VRLLMLTLPVLTRGERPWIEALRAEIGG
jgi:hypothetical protein